MDIEIKYDHGSMTVHLDEFLKCRSIARVRKLVKLIRGSFNPECEEQIRKFVQAELEQFEQSEPKQKELLRYIKGNRQLKERFRTCLSEYNINMKNRDFYKKVLEVLT